MALANAAKSANSGTGRLGGLRYDGGMNPEFAFRFDRGLIRSALRRDYAWRPVVAILLLVGALVGHRAWAGHFDGLIVALVASGTIAVIGVFIVTFRGLVERTFQLWSRQSPSGNMRFVLDDEGFTVCMDQTTSRYHWQGLRRLWRYHDVWIVEIVKNQSVLFPPEAASAEKREFIVERCRRAGVRV
jgi:hypothetical protein